MIKLLIGGILSLISMTVLPQMKKDTLNIFLCGDVMTGRGIDQILPFSVDPVLYESYVKDARRYVEIAEGKSGPIPDEVEYSYIWGDALLVLDKMDPDVRIINLETGITTSTDWWKGKGINYRMHPENTDLFTVADIDCAVLANNHVLDWGYEGLDQTLSSLRQADILTAGAGRNIKAATEPAIIDWFEGRRLLVFSVGSPDSGIPYEWAAENSLPGVFMISGYSSSTIDMIKQNIDEYKKEGDIILLSIHWGSNWGYDVPAKHMHLAHELIDHAGVDIIHGHSSHHVKALEIYNNKLIIYGCGDFINDYEGIGGHDKYRPNLSLMYLPEIDPQSGNLIRLKLSVMEIRKFSLHHASENDRKWMFELLNRITKADGYEYSLNEDVILLER